MSNLKRGFVHTVFFYLKDNAKPENKAKLLEGVHELSKIDLIKTAYIGTAAATRREVIDSSFDVSISFIFDSAEDQDAYQIHEDHLSFVKNYSHLWDSVKVYDAV
jgi:aspartyl/asparaginyl beta-hydroxylase (cupin superfamily)